VSAAASPAVDKGAVDSGAGLVPDVDRGQRVDVYARALTAYCRTRAASALAEAERLAAAFAAEGVGPDTIVEVHLESLVAAMDVLPARQRAQGSLASHQFLLEVVMGYGALVREQLDRLETTSGRRVRRAEKSAARDRARAETSERIGQDQSDALASVAHEMAQPLVALDGNLQLAERALARGEGKRVGPRIGRSREALSRLAGLIADLHRSARGEAWELETEPVDLAEVVEQAVEAARGAAAEKEISLTRAGLAGAPHLVDGDADALLSVVGNLLSNAIRYTPAGGRVAVHQLLEGDRLLTEVRDTGIGIAPELQARIFERLYRAPEARAMVAQGLGVGLALARRLVLAHGGTIEVESEPGRGSTFRLVLPVASMAAASAGAA
jgi:signal transduction histidine kinase